LRSSTSQSPAGCRRSPPDGSEAGAAIRCDPPPSVLTYAHPTSPPAETSRTRQVNPPSTRLWSWMSWVQAPPLAACHRRDHMPCRDLTPPQSPLPVSPPVECRDPTGPNWTRSTASPLDRESHIDADLRHGIWGVTYSQCRERMTIENPSRRSYAGRFRSSQWVQPQSGAWSPEPCAQVRILLGAHRIYQRK
jgi:hypothetical protein